MYRMFTCFDARLPLLQLPLVDEGARSPHVPAFMMPFAEWELPHRPRKLMR